MAETKPTGAKKHITGARIAQEIKQYKKDALISPLYTVCCVILEILIRCAPFRIFAPFILSIFFHLSIFFTALSPPMLH